MDDWQKVISAHWKARILGINKVNRHGGFFELLLIWSLFSVSSALAAPVTVPIIVERYVIPPVARYRFENLPHERTQPIVNGDIVFYSSLSGEVTALHRTGGYALWTTSLGGPVEGAMAYGRSKLFVGDRYGNLHALHARDGSIGWSFKAKAEFLSAPAVSRDTVFAATSDGGLYALEEATGKVRWFYPRIGDEKMTIRGISAPTFFGDHVYIGFADGSLVALSADTGREVWVKRLRTRERFYDVDTTPFVDEKRVVAASFDGTLYALNRLNGDIYWSFKVGSKGGFLVEKERVYFAGLNGNFYALSLESGAVLWKTPFGKGIGLQPASLGNYLVITTSDDPVYVLDKNTGTIVWTHSLGAGTMASAATGAEAWFFCLSNYGNLYSFAVIGESRVKLAVPSTLGTPSALHRHFGKL